MSRTDSNASTRSLESCTGTANCSISLHNAVLFMTSHPFDLITRWASQDEFEPPTRGRRRRPALLQRSHLTAVPSLSLPPAASRGARRVGEPVRAEGQARADPLQFG